MEYTAQYFFNKFSAKTDEEWYSGGFDDPKNPNAHCALGHCIGGKKAGVYEDIALSNLFKSVGKSVMNINDSVKVNGTYRLTTRAEARQAILCALTEIMFKEQ